MLRSGRFPAEQGKTMRRRTRLRAIGVLAAVWLCLGTGVAYAVFTAATANTSSFATAATFRTYPSQVLNNAPLFYHKEEEATTGTSVAADASTNARPGTYSGRLDGPSMWWALDEGSGTTAGDQSGASLPGTLSGATWTTNASPATSGHTGSGVVFNGTSNYVATPRPAAATIASLTVSAWVYLTGANVTRTVAAQSGTFTSAYIVKWTPEAGTTGHWELVTLGSDANAPSGFSGSRGPTITQPTNVWTHLVAVVDVSGANTRLYVNGANSNTGGGSSSGYSSSLWSAGGAFQIVCGTEPGAQPRRATSIPGSTTRRRRCGDSTTSPRPRRPRPTPPPTATRERRRGSPSRRRRRSTGRP